MFPNRSRVVGLCMAVLLGWLLGGCSTLGSPALAESVASGYTQYAYAFVSFEADRLEARDARAAQALRERAAQLYARARHQALSALEADQPGFLTALSQPDPARWPSLRADQVGLAYWGAAAWAGQISLSKDDPEIVADLPLAIRLAERAYATAPDHGDGALASLMGTLEAARPGGSPTRALAYFDQALQLGQGRQAGALLAKAEGWAQPAGDKAAFAALLDEALAVNARHPSLANDAARQRAQWLLDQIDDLF